MANVNSRSYHGQKKRKSIGSFTSAACAAAVALTLDASKGDLFTLTTSPCGCGASAVSFDITNAHDGQVIDIIYDANDACDDTCIVVTLEGLAVVGSGLTAVASGNVNFIKVYVYDADGGANAGAYTTITT